MLERAADRTRRGRGCGQFRREFPGQRPAELDAGAWHRLAREARRSRRSRRTPNSGARCERRCRYSKLILSSFSALPQNSLRSSAGDRPRPLTVLIVGAIGPSGVSVAKTTRIRAEKLIPATRCRHAAAEHGGVGVKVVQVIRVRPFQRRQDFRIILVRCALAQDLEAVADAAIKIWDHAAEMVRDDLQFRIAVEQPVEHHAHHGHGRFIGPVEAPPHLVARFFLGRIIRHRRGADRMQPDRQIEFRHALRKAARISADRAARRRRWCRSARRARRGL